MRILEARFQGLWGQNFEDSGSGILRILKTDFGDFEDQNLENFGDSSQLGDSKVWDVSATLATSVFLVFTKTRWSFDLFGLE